MRVAFLTWRDSTHPDGGGSEVFVEQVAKGLVARGHEVTIVCAGHGDAPAESDLDGVRVLRTGGRLTVYPRALLWLVRNRRTDAVVDVINGLPFGTPLVRRRGVVALVHHVHQRQWRIIYPGLRGRVGWFVESRLTPAAYRRLPHLTVSEASRRDLAGLGIPEGSITVVRNGLAARRSPAGRSDTPRLCVLARLVPHKQIEHAVTVAVRLREEFPGLVLDVVGEGWWRPELEAAVHDQAAGDVVRFHGHVSDAERDRLLAEAWLVLLPSVKEGWGLAVLEAAAQRTATVAYRDAGGVTESIVDGRTGLLVDDLDEMTAVTRKVLANPWTRDRLGEAAALRARDFDWSVTTGVVEEVLREAVEKKGQRSP